MTIRIAGRTFAKVKGRPGILEAVGTVYRPIERGSGGPFMLDQGPDGGTQTPQMTKPEPYLSAAEHLRILGGNPRAASARDAAFASSSTTDKPMKRRRGSAD